MTDCNSPRSRSKEEREFRLDLINALDQIGITLETINETLLKKKAKND